MLDSNKDSSLKLPEVNFMLKTDDEDSETEDDNEVETDIDTPRSSKVVRLNMSSDTLIPEDSERVHSRLVEVFSQDIDELVKIVTSMPDGEAKEHLIRDILIGGQNMIRSLKNAITLNTSFIILSTFLDD